MLERYDPRNWPISYDGVIHTLIVLGSAVALALRAGPASWHGELAQRAGAHELADGVSTIDVGTYVQPS